MSRRGTPVTCWDDITPRGIYMSRDPNWPFLRIVRIEDRIFIRYYQTELDAIHDDWNCFLKSPFVDRPLSPAWHEHRRGPLEEIKLFQMKLRRLSDDGEDLPL